jgi:hypothetical protein
MSTAWLQQGSVAIRSAALSVIYDQYSSQGSAHDSIDPMSNHAQHFFEHGWCRFDSDARLLRWVESALPAARAARADAQHARWLRYQGTWFAGVNVLANHADSSVDEGEPLQGEAIDFVAAELEPGEFDWDRAQVSICYPGYPQPMAGESTARTRYRRERDAAHVDGLLREGPGQRRHLREHHGFILGIPLVEFDAGAAPFVVWEGSQDIMRSAFAARFEGLDPQQWGEQDITEAYHAAREAAFAHCRRVEIHARPGEAFLAHRLVLHGMAPWQPAARAGPDGRMVCYFRPATLGPFEWLHNP